MSIEIYTAALHTVNCAEPQTVSALFRHPLLISINNLYNPDMEQSVRSIIETINYYYLLFVLL